MDEKREVIGSAEKTVMDKIGDRALMGLWKYGVTTDRKDLSKLQWLCHAQEEALDLAIYLQKLIELETKTK